MARIRSNHPGRWTDEEFVTSSPLARLLLLGLENEADDYGVFSWKPITIKMRVLPADHVDVSDLLGELEANNKVRRFEFDGRSYGAIRNFCKFQRPKKPNQYNPLPKRLYSYVGYSGADLAMGADDGSNGGGNDSSEPVGNQFGTSGENGPQKGIGVGGGIGLEEREEVRVPPPPYESHTHATADDGEEVQPDCPVEPVEVEAPETVSDETMAELIERCPLLSPQRVRREVAVWVRSIGSAAETERIILAALRTARDPIGYASRVIGKKSADVVEAVERGRTVAERPPPAPWKSDSELGGELFLQTLAEMEARGHG